MNVRVKSPVRFPIAPLLLAAMALGACAPELPVAAAGAPAEQILVSEADCTEAATVDASPLPRVLPAAGLTPDKPVACGILSRPGRAIPPVSYGWAPAFARAPPRLPLT